MNSVDLPAEAVHPSVHCPGCRRPMVKRSWGRAARADGTGVPAGAVVFAAWGQCERCYRIDRQQGGGAGPSTRGRPMSTEHNARGLESYLSARRQIIARRARAGRPGRAAA